MSSENAVVVNWLSNVELFVVHFLCTSLYYTPVNNEVRAICAVLNVRLIGLT